MPLATRSSDELAHSGGFSPLVGRPLFVPSGIRVVRTGPTTRAELDRLLGDAAEASGVRLRPISGSGAGTSRGWLRTFTAMFSGWSLR